MITLCSENINAVHRPRGRGITVTEEPRLHLVYRIFIKPIPRYLLSYGFWECYLDKSSNKLDKNRSDIRKAAATRQTLKLLSKNTSAQPLMTLIGRPSVVSRQSLGA
ncbi:hypothetical protein SVAN01_09415 [Stagonosporopsis vannaccii]|nr:hypothetical protein SVAN01_09415 [Stagonosporopsis vannaccii]